MTGERGPGPEVLLAGGAVVLTQLAGAVWFGAELASLIAGGHRYLDLSVGDAFRALPALAANPGRPADAWPARAAGGLPGPVAYWAVSGFVLAVLAAAVTVVVVLVWQQRAGVARRRRMGLDPEARFARPADLAPLWVTGPARGRLLLGRVRSSWPLPGPGRWQLVATEDASRPLDPSVPFWLRGRARARRGDRGSVVVVGPTRCGKTAALAVPAILEWDGPVVALSVKTDLMGATLARRRQLGEVRVFDPTGVTGEPSAAWSPLAGADRLAGARRAARSVGNSTGWTANTSGDMSFWNSAAEELLAQLLWTAAVAGLGMDSVVGWVTTTAKDDVLALLSPFARHADPDVADDGQQVLKAFTALWRGDAKQVASVYLVARQLVMPWQEAAVARSAHGLLVDLDWLLTPPSPTPTFLGPGTGGVGSAGGGGPVGGGGNTVFLCADLDDAERLAPVLGGCVDDLLRGVYAQVAATGRPLDPPLLVVVDEAGNWPMRNLPGRISTCAGMGVQLLLVYQSKAQVDAAYGAKADVVLSNATTKVLFAGLSDRSSLDYAASLLGSEHVLARSVTSEPGLVGGPRGVSDAPTRLDLLPAALLRQVAPGQALLFHQTLPPAHLHGRYWFRDRHLLHLATPGTPPPRPSRRSHDVGRARSLPAQLAAVLRRPRRGRPVWPERGSR